VKIPASVAQSFARKKARNLAEEVAVAEYGKRIVLSADLTEPTAVSQLAGHSSHAPQEPLRRQFSAPRFIDSPCCVAGRLCYHEATLRPHTGYFHRALVC
jgi:hypothetical protein